MPYMRRRCIIHSRAGNSFCELTSLNLSGLYQESNATMGSEYIELEYILLAPHFVREVLEIYEGWKGKESVPLKVQELMMVLQIEADQLHR